MSKSPSRIEPRRLNKFQTYLLRPSVRLSVHTYEIDFLNKLDMSKSPSRINKSYEVNYSLIRTLIVL